MPCNDIGIAYFSMEIAAGPRYLAYSGGLGVLAGDTLRSAADLTVVRSSSSNKPQRLQVFRSVGAALDYHTACIAVLKRIDVAACTAQPEVLHGMGVSGFLTGWMIFMEAKEQPFPIVKRCVAIRVCANCKHEDLISSNDQPSGSGSESRPYVDLRKL
jgi:hypothetical protein